MNRNLLRNFLRRRRGFVCAGLLLLGPDASLRAQTNEVKPMPPPAPRRPSIILILADNLGYGDLGCYGQTKIKTPNLDRLAKEGIRFTSFYAGSPDDAAARAALLTGLEPRHLRAGFNQTLPSGAVTVAALLKQQGYRTGLIGTWGLGDTGAAMPDKNGFEEFAGFLSTDHAREYFTDRIWRHRLMEGDAQMVFPENENGKRGQFMPDLLTTFALNFVRINKPEPFNKFRPFFLCLAYPIPHVSANAAPPGGSDYADAPWPPLERIRATLITRMDDSVGQLLKKLDDLKISTNTVVIFTSVGGPQTERAMTTNFFNSTGGLRGGQGSLNEGGLRVPMVLRWPAQIKAGGASDLTCAAWDFLPTAAEIAFMPQPEKLDGVSLMPTLLGQTQTNRHESLYWETSAEGFKQAVRMGDWKAIRHATGQPPELFSLKTDPAEKENVATNHADVLAKLEKILKSAKDSAQP